MVRQGQTSIDLFHERVPACGRVRFHCRFQRAVYACYKNHPRHISRAVRLVLLKFRKALDGGMFNLSRVSRFLAREDVTDKVELHLQLTVADKDLIEKLAFALRISQSELLRMALEWHMEAMRPQSPRCVFYAARRKWHHRRVKPRPESMAFSFWTFGRSLEWQFPPQKAAQDAHDLLRDPNPDRFRRKARPNRV